LLRMWPVRHRLDCGIEAEVLVIGHHTDDLGRHVLVFHVDRKASAKWFGTAEVLAHKSFIDEHDVSHLSRLLFSEEATALQRNLHSLKVVGVSDADSCL